MSSEEYYETINRRMRYAITVSFIGMGLGAFLVAALLPTFIPAPGAEAMAPAIVMGGIFGLASAAFFYYLFTKRLMKADGSDSKSGTSDKIQP